MTNPPLTILLIEDNPADARFLRELLRDAGAGVAHLIHVEKLSAASQRLAEEPVDIILLDAVLPDSKGTEMLRQLQTHQDVPVVILSGLPDETAARQMVGNEAQGYLMKGQLNGPTLVRTLRDVIARHQARSKM